VGLETFRTSRKILTDIAERKPTDATTAGDIVSKHVNGSTLMLISKLGGRGRKSGREVGGKKRGLKPQISSVPGKKYKKRTSFPSFTSITLQ